MPSPKVIKSAPSAPRSGCDQRRSSCGLLAVGVLVGAGGLMPMAVRADLTSEPLWVENLSPTAGLVALPSMRSANVVEGWKLDSNVAIASHFVASQSGDESLLFDGETTRATLALEYGWSPDWSVRVSAPWVSHDAGFLDSLINGWHDFFGMSDGGRSAYPEDQFSYRYQAAAHGFDMTAADSGLGDIRIELNHAFYRIPGQVASVSLGYKPPSGDEQRFTGSGAGDLFATLRFSGDHLSDLPLTWHAQAGYTYAGDSDVLGPAQENHLWFVGLGVDWQVAQHWSLLAQYDGHAAVMASDIDALGGDAGLLSLGLRWRVAPGWAVDLSFIEDVVVETAPDVTFQASLRWRPEG